MSASSAGSTADLEVCAASFAGFIEGGKYLHGGRFTYFNQLGTNVVDAGDYHHLFTVKNKLFYKGRANQSVVNVISLSAALKHTSPCIIYLVKNADLVGNPNFQDRSANSCTSWDTAATTGSWTNGEQLLWTGHLGDTGELDHHFNGSAHNAEEITLQPGERISVFARTSTGTATFVTASLNTREDQ
jgi:hypothetical protein